MLSLAELVCVPAILRCVPKLAAAFAVFEVTVIVPAYCEMSESWNVVRAAHDGVGAAWPFAVDLQRKAVVLAGIGGLARDGTGIDCPVRCGVLHQQKLGADRRIKRRAVLIAYESVRDYRRLGNGYRQHGRRKESCGYG